MVTTTGKYAKAICECCGERKNGTFFYPNYGIQYKDRLKARYCKDCCAKKIEEYSQFLNEKASLWMVLSELGIPFINQVYSASPSATRVAACFSAWARRTVTCS